VISRMVEAYGPGLRARRLAALDMPVPAAGPLETAVLPGEEDIVKAAMAMMD